MAAIKRIHPPLSARGNPPGVDVETEGWLDGDGSVTDDAGWTPSARSFKLAFVHAATILEPRMSA
jgi:hypothetical protein